MATLRISKISMAQDFCGDNLMGWGLHSAADYGIFYGAELVAVIRRTDRGGYRAAQRWEPQTIGRPWTSLMPSENTLRAMKAAVLEDPDYTAERFAATCVEIGLRALTR